MRMIAILCAALMLTLSCGNAAQCAQKKKLKLSNSYTEDRKGDRLL